MADVKPAYGPTNPSPEESAKTKPQRVASIVELNPEMEQKYRDLHADVWDSVIARIRASNIRNYSIHVAEIQGKRYLFSYFEYIGDDLDADMAAMGDDPETQRWWAETAPCQIRMPQCEEGEQWLPLERVFLME